MKLLCTHTNKIMNIKDCSNTIRRGQAMKLHLRKNKIDPFKLVRDLGFGFKKCYWCGGENLNHVTLITNIHDNKITLTGYDYLRYGVNCCFSNECPSNGLNPNSLEFVKGAYGFSSDDEARAYLHSRNKSPFYRENHNSDEEYANAQSRGKTWWEENSDKSRDDWIAKANKSRSLDSYIMKYPDGFKRWNNIQQQKAITLKNCVERYGEIEGQDRYDQWKKSIIIDLPNFITKYGNISGPLRYIEYINKKSSFQANITSYDDYLNVLYQYLINNKLYILTTFNFIEFIQNYTLFGIGNSLFGKTNSDIEIDMRNKFTDICMLPGNYIKNKSQLGHRITLYTGRKFNSVKELYFYIKLKMIGFHDINIKNNQKYPNSPLFYDFFLPQLDTYIEIAGLLGHCMSYDKNIEFKKQSLNAIIVTDNNEEVILEEIRKKYNELGK